MEKSRNNKVRGRSDSPESHQPKKAASVSAPTTPQVTPRPKPHSPPEARSTVRSQGGPLLVSIQELHEELIDTFKACQKENAEKVVHDICSHFKKHNEDVLKGVRTELRRQEARAKEDASPTAPMSTTFSQSAGENIDSSPKPPRPTPRPQRQAPLALGGGVNMLERVMNKADERALKVDRRKSIQTGKPAGSEDIPFQKVLSEHKARNSATSAPLLSVFSSSTVMEPVMEAESPGLPGMEPVTDSTSMSSKSVRTLSRDDVVENRSAEPSKPMFALQGMQLYGASNGSVTEEELALLMSSRSSANVSPTPRSPQAADDPYISERSQVTVSKKPRLSVSDRVTNVRYHFEELDEDPEAEMFDDVESQESGLEKFLKGVLKTTWFEMTVCAMVLINGIIIAFETDFAASQLTTTPPLFCTVAEDIFFFAFATELALRIAAFRKQFFTMYGFEWNIFDSVVVAMQAVQVVGQAFFQGKTKNLSILRLVRIARLLRVTRILRVVRFVEELRILVGLVATCVRSVFWTLVLMIVVVYSVAIVLTQTVTDERLERAQVDDSDSLLNDWFGSLSASALTLYKCMSYGIEWERVMNLLTDECGLNVGMIICVFVFFTQFAFVNLITGVVTEKAIKFSDQAQEEQLAARIIEAFEGADSDESGDLTWEEFHGSLQNKEMREYFKAIDVDPSEARGLFQLLDVDGNGLVDLVEFGSGCIRLRGTGKALQLALHAHEVAKMNDWQMERVENIEACCKAMLRITQGEGLPLNDGKNREDFESGISAHSSN